MRMCAAALFASVSLLCAAPAFAQESEPAVSGSFGVAISSEWLYTDQAYNETEYTDDLFTSVDASVCRYSTCVSAWYGKAGSVSELDLVASHSIEVGEYTVDLEGGIFLVEGPEIWDAKIAVSRSLFCTACTVSVSYEAMRGSFVDDVLKVELSNEGSLSERVDYDLTVGFGHSRFADGYVVPFEAGVSVSLRDTIAARLFVQGYLSDESRTTIGLALTSGF